MGTVAARRRATFDKDVTISEQVALLGTIGAHLGAQTTRPSKQWGLAKDEVLVRIADLRAVQEQADHGRLGVRTAQRQKVSKSLHA